MAKPLGVSKNLPLGKAVSSRINPSIPVGARLKCADNTGAKELEIIAVKKYTGVRRRIPMAGVGSLVVCSVKKGRQDLRKQVVLAIVVRQKKPYTRYNGAKISFADNAAVVVSEDGLPKGTEIKTPVAREAVERWVKIGSIASIVV
ncbi:MAG: 50S ribosomal protein L14 [Candidatus Altiarchaeales archaeon ex4484_96]|nr:MAG: 50S ribosomal protein L14 [Candidatus Altiarchaeales archaeon ex4484_96]